MQEPGDSFNVRAYLGKLGKLEEEARSLSNSIRNFLSEIGSNRLIISYNGHGYLPASCMFWHVVTMDEEKSILLLDIPSTSLYVLAYRDPTPLIIYTSNHSGLLNILQIARIMNHPYMALVAKPVNEKIVEVLKSYNIIYTSIDDELDSTLVMAIAVFHALASIYKDRLSKRGVRVFEHSREGFTLIAGELIEVYKEVFSKVSLHRELVVSSSRLMESSARYLVDALKRRQVNARYEYPESIPNSADVLLIGTSVEEYYLRELKSRLAVGKTRVNELILNTDPIEANIYLAIIANYLAWSTRYKHNG
ncbi:hypothetical protein [Desulfurococcus amylolyticus]|uniref:Uncharacterized protein n=1 Tax=Desulfurococcus amylolyticus DSM 16532 TaxID=768672 RepID=I3XSV7_DESAM|nr:hypothetical protein [Desulfurococcus amylolyticus]AFL67031.1 hypothetical protein Desfe_1160 [Desulfurococcus amylolyticus DSM 16532]